MLGREEGRRGEEGTQPRGSPSEGKAPLLTCQPDGTTPVPCPHCLPDSGGGALCLSRWQEPLWAVGLGRGGYRNWRNTATTSPASPTRGQSSLGDACVSLRPLDTCHPDAAGAAVPRETCSLPCPPGCPAHLSKGRHHLPSHSARHGLPAAGPGLHHSRTSLSLPRSVCPLSSPSLSPQLGAPPTDLRCLKKKNPNREQ